LPKATIEANTSAAAPAAALFTTWALQSILAAASVMTLSGLVPPLSAILVAVAGFGLIAARRRAPRIPFPAAQPAATG
jgi:hypothetical protein